MKDPVKNIPASLMDILEATGREVARAVTDDDLIITLLRFNGELFGESNECRGYALLTTDGVQDMWYAFDHDEFAEASELFVALENAK